MPDSNWLEGELSRQLAPVTAPQSLWDRIEAGGRSAHRRPSHAWVLWPVAAALALMALAGVWRIRSGTAEPDPFREQELVLLRTPVHGYDAHPANLQETRAWAKAEANIDIDTPSGEPAPDKGAVRLIGARMMNYRGLRVAAINYRAGDESATLFVSAKRAGLSGNTEISKHLFSQIASEGDQRIVSWNMRNQTYSIAWPGAKSSRGACLLCHASIPG
ncbi:MAG TPA: hypothetical protein VG297_13905 [Bryobacteraceae bacterium]|nr:hypothetical protein [Bryobacteraceae bacterium]